jgi:hypothetical protein
VRDQQVCLRIEDTQLQISQDGWRSLTTLKKSEWYHVKLVVNSPSDGQFQVFVDDGSGWQALNKGIGIPFRNAPAGDLVSFFIHCNNGNNGGGNLLLIDDVYLRR